MMKRVTLGADPHGTMKTNWTSNGMTIFSALTPGAKAELVNGATSPAGRRALEQIVTTDDGDHDVMTLLVLALEQHGLDKTKQALSG